jgi:flagellar M-ring protein FliF
MIRQLTVSQRIGVLFGAVFSVLLMVGLVVWAGQPQMTSAFTNVATKDAGTITDALKTAGIPYALADGGATIQVPASQLAAARIAAGSTGYTGGAATGMELFDKQGFGASEFDQQVTYQRALQGELTNTIMKIDGVAEANVSLVAAKTGILTSSDQAASASVYVRMKDGQVPTSDVISGIVGIVAGGVGGLSPQNVTVVGSNGEVLAGPSNTASTAATIKGTTERDLATKVQTLLDSVLGTTAGKDGGAATKNAQVAVTADLNLDQVEKQITSVMPIDTQHWTPVSVSDSSEVYGNGATSGANGIPGSYSNVPGLANYPAVPAGSASPSGSPTASGSPAPEASSSYVKTSSTVNFANSAEVDKIISTPGAINRLSIAVLVSNDALTKAGLKADDLKAAIVAATGAVWNTDATKSRDNVAVVPVTFAAAAALPASSPDLLGGVAGMLPTVGGVLLSVALLFLVWRNMRALRRRAEDMQLSASRLGMPALSADTGAGFQAAMAGGYREEMPQIPDSPQARIQERIRAVATEQPDEIASLVTTWLRDDERTKRR